MANSLIELYGGGMTGKSNNYQLGGRVASARRRRDYQGEMRELSRKQEEANRRKKKSGFLGTLGSIAGGTVGFMLGGPGGAAIGAGLGRGAGESSYAREDFGGGKYAQDTRGELSRGEDDYRRGIGGRALVTGLQSAIMPAIFEKGAGWLKGLNPGATPAGFIPVSELEAATTAAQSAATSVAPAAAVSSVIPEVTSAVSPTVSTAPATLIPEGLDFLSGGFDLSTTAQPQANPEYEYFGPFFNRGGGLIDMTMPQYENGGMVRERYDAMNRPTSFGNQVNSDGEMRNPYGQPTQPQAPYTPPPSPYTSGYGTATDATGALRQLGMTGVALDPRLQQYMGDLPDFQMGYAQQVGDIYSGARQSARGMRGQQMQAAGQRGFTKSGIGQRQTQQAFGDLRTDVARQRRGVVEGYQADVLGAVGDIEAKGQFEFGTSPEAMSAVVGDSLSRLRDAAEQRGFNPTQTTMMQPSQEQEDEMQDYYSNMYG